METKIKGVKKGTKRGTYKKRTNETIINNVDNVEITNVQTLQPTNETIVEPIQNETIDKNDVNTIDKQVNDEPNVSQSNTVNFGNEQQNQRTEFQQTTAEEKLNSFFNEYQQINDEPNDNKNEPEQRQQDPKLKMIINGYMLLSICDVVFPYGIKFLFGLFNPKAKKVKAKDIQLEPEQRQALLGAADQVAQYVFQKANPMTIFIICMGLFYGTNFSNALNEIKDK
jgi:hypothetical protein